MGLQQNWRDSAGSTRSGSGSLATVTDRRCRFEQMEPRRLLAAIGLSQSVASQLFESPSPISSTPSSLSTIQGSVHVSSDQQNHACETHAGLAGVVVGLLNETGEVVEQHATDAHGNYEFNNLAPGIYAVQHHTLDNYVAVAANGGNGGGIVFSPNLIGEIFVVAGSLLSGYDFCDSTAETLLEQSGREGPRIVIHSAPASLENIFILPANFFSAAKTAPLSAPFNAPASFVALPVIFRPLLVPPNATQDEAIFGSSSKKLKNESSDFNALFDEIFASLSREKQHYDEHFAEYSSDAEAGFAPHAEQSTAREIVDQAFEGNLPTESEFERVSAITPNSSRPANWQPHLARRSGAGN